MSDRYQPIIDALNLKQLESKKKLGDEDREGEGQIQGGEEEEVQIVGTKRRRRASRKKQKQVSRKRTFLDDEAQLSGEDDDGDDDSDSDGSDVEGLLDDSSDVEENNTSFYRAVDNNVSAQPGPSTAVQTPPLSTATLLTHEQEEVERKRLKKIKEFLSKLLICIDQITILGFNSQKYGIPLIRSYLPSSIIKHDCIPKQIIKKMNGYMALSSKKKKFLDITNYLAAGTSLKAFYESYCVSTPEGSFPYSWFDSLEKLDATSLPDDIEVFCSILTKKPITPDEFQSCRDV